MTVTPLPVPGVTPANWGGVLNAAIESRYQDVLARLPRFTPEMFGAIGDGVTDDTAAFVDAIAEALPVNGVIELGPKVYGISEKLQLLGLGTAVTLIGQGSDGTAGGEGSTLKALGPDACVAWGSFPTGPGQTGVTLFGRPGMSQGWQFDGDFVANEGIIIGSSVGYGVWSNISCHQTLGDGWNIAPQNCYFLSCISHGHEGNGWSLDYGIQACDFIGCHSGGNNGWGFDIRQSGGANWGGSGQPQALRFASGIVEAGGNPFPGHEGPGLGGFHIREGLDITFERMELGETAGDGALVLSLPVTPLCYVGRVIVRDSRVGRIYLDANVGGVAQLFPGTNEPLMLDGWNFIEEITNGSAGPVYDNMTGTVNAYNTEGTGAVATLAKQYRTKSAGQVLQSWLNEAGFTKVLFENDGDIRARFAAADEVVIGNGLGVGAGVLMGGDTQLTRVGPASIYTNRMEHQSLNPDTSPLVVTADDTQVEPNIVVRDSGGGGLMIVDKDGNTIARFGRAEQVQIGNVFGFPGILLGADALFIRIGPSEVSTNRVIMQGAGAGVTPTSVRAQGGQTADLLSVEDSGGVGMWSVSAAGVPTWKTSANEQTTVGAAGAAAAPPASPTKYLKVKDSAGNTLVIPAYEDV